MVGYVEIFCDGNTFLLLHKLHTDFFKLGKSLISHEKICKNVKTVLTFMIYCMSLIHTNTCTLTFAELPGLIKDIKDIKEQNRQIKRMRKAQSKCTHTQLKHFFLDLIN